MSKSSEPTTALYDSNGNFIGEIATKNSRIMLRDKSGDELYHDGSGWVADPSVSTDALNITEQINYWPPVRVDAVVEVNDDSPPTTYTSQSLTTPPADAVGALLTFGITGDGTSSSMRLDVREAGSSRGHDARLGGWAGHGSDSSEHSPYFCPMNSNNEIEYKCPPGNTANVLIQTVGYY